MLMLNLSHNVLIHDPKGFETEEAKNIKNDKMAKYAVRLAMENKFTEEIRLENNRSRLTGGRSSAGSNKSSRKNNKRTRTMENIEIVSSRSKASSISRKRGNNNSPFKRTEKKGDP